MKIVFEMPLSDFKFWSGAKDFASQLTEAQFNMVEAMLGDCYPDGISDTEINDLFWFEQEAVRMWADMPCEELENIPKEAQNVLNEYYDLDSFDGSTEAVEEYENREVYYIPEANKEKFNSVRESYENALDNDELFDNNEDGNRDTLIWFDSIEDGYLQ